MARIYRIDVLGKCLRGIECVPDGGRAHEQVRNCGMAQGVECNVQRERGIESEHIPEHLFEDFNIAFGVFDGLHIGHISLIESAMACASSGECEIGEKKDRTALKNVREYGCRSESVV